MTINARMVRGAQSRLRGLYAEVWAAIWLVLKGYSIVAWRFRSRAGEVDIIARKGQVIAMVEVKQRHDHMTAGESMNDYDWHRRTNAANYFLQRHPQYANYSVRFDLVIISKNFAIKHITDAHTVI